MSVDCSFLQMHRSNFKGPCNPQGPNEHENLKARMKHESVLTLTIILVGHNEFQSEAVIRRRKKIYTNPIFNNKQLQVVLSTALHPSSMTLDLLYTLVMVIPIVNTTTLITKE